MILLYKGLMRMRKRMRYRYILLPLVLLALSLAALLWNDHRSRLQTIKAFRQSGGEIVTIFIEQLKEDEVDELTAHLSVPVKILRHIEDYALISTGNPSEYQAALKELKGHPLVKAVEGNSSISPMGIPNDPYFDSQWALDNQGSYSTYTRGSRTQVIRSTADVDMNVPEAWEYLRDSGLSKREVIVAIIDTGADIRHPDLQGVFWENSGEIPDDGLDNDNNGYVDDIHGWDFYNGDNTLCHYRYNERFGLYMADPKDNDDHGTHIAGVIGARDDNNLGIVGIASDVNVKLMILKINGGVDGTGNISNAVEAIKYATKMGADICNLSWGTYQYTAALKEVIAESDMLFVTAAGNSGDDNNVKPIYPASFDLPNVISVTYIDGDGKLTKYSNHGSKTVDIAAPGHEIYSTTVGSYDTLSGSSMAAPHVSAIAAFLYSFEENIYPANIKNLIISYSKPMPKLEGKIINPAIPDAFLLVSSASGELMKDTIAPVLKPETIYDQSILRVPLNIIEEGGSGLRVVRWLSGEKSLEDFRHGTEGTVVTGDAAELNRAGIYTFYAGDYAGNEASVVYEVLDDVTAPKITASYTVSSSYKTRQVTVKVSDEQSGIKRVKYMAGTKSAMDFLPAGAGTEIELTNGKGGFKLTKDGTYTIYAIDNRGNTSVTRIKVKTIKATGLKLSRSTKTMKVGEKFLLEAYPNPANTTDQITFASSNTSIATVTSNGTVKAHKAGSVTITATTSSGIKASCRITVKK